MTVFTAMSSLSATTGHSAKALSYMNSQKMSTASAYSSATTRTPCSTSTTSNSAKRQKLRPDSVRTATSQKEWKAGQPENEGAGVSVIDMDGTPSGNNKVMKLISSADSKEAYDLKVLSPDMPTMPGSKVEISFFVKSEGTGKGRLTFKGMTNEWPLDQLDRQSVKLGRSIRDIR